MTYLIGGQSIKGVEYHQDLSSSGFSLSSNSSSNSSSYLSDRLLLRRQNLTSEQLALCLEQQVHCNSMDECNVSRNQLTYIPTTLQFFMNLSTLVLSNNRIQEIPREIYTSLTLLTTLILSDNQIEAIPWDMPLYLTSLSTLCIDSNSLTSLPDTINEWKEMQVFRIGSAYGGNHLRTLPDISNMTQLVDLDISFNQLDSLLVFENSKLSSLNLSHNQLIRIPQFINCKALASLDFSDNQIELIEAHDILTLPQLALLNLGENQLQSIPSELINSNIQLIVKDNPMTTSDNDPLSDSPHDNTTNNVISLGELALRQIVSHKKTWPAIPDHLQHQLLVNQSKCTFCQNPFVCEWTKATEPMSYHGQTLTQEIKFCSTRCRMLYEKERKQQALAIESRIERQRQEAFIFVTEHDLQPGSFDWIVAAVEASREQTQHLDLLLNRM